MFIRTLAVLAAGTIVAGALATSAIAAPGGSDQQLITVRKAGGVPPEGIIAVL
jgi:hypothetical protein